MIFSLAWKFCQKFVKKNSEFVSVQYSTITWPSSKHEAILLSSLIDTYAYEKFLNKTAILRAQGKAGEFEHEIKKNILHLSFTYEELNTKLVEENPKYDIWGLLSNIGGTLGLYVGISFITLFEILEVISDLLLYFCCYRCKKST